MKARFLQSNSMKSYGDLLWAMTEREFKARYKSAVLGFLWVILNPLLQMLIVGLIFSFFVDIPNYFLFLFSGLLPWQFFSLSVSKVTSIFVNERGLLKKAKFPREVIPLSVVFSNFLHLLVSFSLLLIFLIITQQMVWANILFLFLALLWLLCFTLGFSLLTSTLMVRFRDVKFFVQTIVMLWFYATPVLYGLHLIPDSFHIFYSFNPLTAVFMFFHYSLVGQQVIALPLVISNLVISILVILLGIFVFYKEKDRLTDWL